ncbi:MAG TPA: hypothetical protein VHJ20_08390 [Polyangia bacterium]|nr:hypothetical protein [Polyangia bacterium]
MAALGLAACATSEPPPAIVPLPPPPRAAPAAVRLAWLPVETRASASLARALNERLARVGVDGVSETFQAPVSMEMAQLAIECIEHTPACYTAVGHSLGADRLLWAELERGGHGVVTVRVSLFDVGGGEIVKKAEKGYASAAAAKSGVGPLVDAAFGASVAKADDAKGATP